MSRSLTPLLLVLAVLASIGLASPATAQEAEPTRPLPLSAPPVPARMQGQRDIAAIRGDRLRASAIQLARDGRVEEAIQLQHWGIHAEQGGGEGHYNLACFYALAGRTDAAFYWLQRAAKEEGADAAWAEADTDLVTLREDPRWKSVADFLRAWNAWWAKNGRAITLLVLPEGYTQGRAIPAVVGLHGVGSHPRDFADPASYQALADALGVAFVGVSGTTPVGPTRFGWAEDPTRDRSRIDAALAEVKDRVTIAPGTVVLAGFSQGAQVAAELAARDPAAFAGAIVLSPGGRTRARLAELAGTPAHARRGFVIRVNGGEHPTTVVNAEAHRVALTRLGCRVDHHSYPDADRHAFPADFGRSLGGWVTFVLGDRWPLPTAGPPAPR